MYQVNFNINVSFKGFIRFRKWLTQFYINFYLSIHLTYSLFLFLFLNYFPYRKFLLICFFQLFLIKWSPLRPLITYVHGTLFLILLITETSSEQFRVYVLAKMCFYFDILPWSPIWKFLLLNSLLESIYV